MGHVCSSARLHSCLLVYAFNEPLDNTDPAVLGGRDLIDPCVILLRQKVRQRRKRRVNVIFVKIGRLKNDRFYYYQLKILIKSDYC